MSFYSTPPRDPRSAAFSLSTPPSPSPSTSHHAATVQPPSPPAAVSSLHRQPCFASRDYPPQLRAASSHRQCIGVAGRVVPQGSRPLHAFSSYNEAPTALGPLPPPPPLVNRPGFQYERVPTLDEILATKGTTTMNPIPEPESSYPNEDSDSDSYTMTHFANDMRRYRWMV